jgi:hypothetical protein
MRASSGGVFVALALFGASACGALDGLSDYESGSGLSDSGTIHPVDAHSDTSSQSPTGDDDSVEPDTGNPSGPTDDGSPLEPEAGDDTSDDGGSTNGDGGSPDDVENIPDVAVDAAPACTSMTCGGCCMNGTCYGGSSVSTCGKGGSACKDCSSQGACSANGSCSTPQVDSGHQTSCSASSCLLCIPVYQQGCCKSDDTCGCQVVIPTRGSCN